MRRGRGQLQPSVTPACSRERPSPGKQMFAARLRIHGLTALVGIVGNTLLRVSRVGWSFWTLLFWSRCHPMTWLRSSPSI
jgi:hypothetical protein